MTIIVCQGHTMCTTQLCKCPHRALVATLLALGASPAGETPKTLERLRRAMASRHALLHAHASLDPNVAIRFILGGVKLCTIV